MTGLVFGIVALLATAVAQAAASEGKDYLLLQLQNPLVNLSTRNGERSPGSRNFSFGPVSVLADDITADGVS